MHSFSLFRLSLYSRIDNNTTRGCSMIPAERADHTYKQHMYWYLYLLRGGCARGTQQLSRNIEWSFYKACFRITTTAASNDNITTGSTVQEAHELAPLRVRWLCKIRDILYSRIQTTPARALNREERGTI